ncbi:MAG: AAA family ATPase [Proteobacteria bacterium]|nr:AAA family ATPase [Pseudomonadota bacterium]
MKNNKKHNVIKPIVLIGMMGSGKSTVGKRLARKLRLQFYDSDKVMESREGLSIVDIVEFKGWDYIQRKEREVIEEILGYGPVVLSTGGNSFIAQEIRQLILQKGIAIWLQADFDTLYKRITRRNTRPEFNVGNQHETLTNMLKEREAIYTEAHISVASGNEDVACLVDKIITQLMPHMG